MESEYIQVRRSQLNFYEEIPLFSQTNETQFVLYKPPGITLNQMRVKDGRLPEKLYIKQNDKIRGIQEVQKVFNRQLKESIRSNNPGKVKEIIVKLMEETLSEPRSGSLEGVSETVDILVSDYTQRSDIIKKLLFVSSKDYTTALHSINVMALVLGYATLLNYPLEEKRVLGLAALLHDVGKTKINSELLKVPRKLTDDEFHEIQQHTVLGAKILDTCKFSSSQVKLAARQHHEKLDGSGYPGHLNHISKVAQIVGLVDCYEALTNDDRPYRRAMEPVRALELIKKDVAANKFDRDIFETFVRSLAR